MKNRWNKETSGSDMETFYDDGLIEVDHSMDAGENETGKEKSTRKIERKLFYMVTVLLGMICIIIVLSIALYNDDWDLTSQTGYKHENGYVTGSAEEQTEAQTSKNQKGDMENTEAAAEQRENTSSKDDSAGEADGTANDDWKQTIFGQASTQALSRMISVKDITDEMIGDQGFSQTAFVKAAGSFLADHGIRASSIRFGKPVMVSIKDAFGYEADIIGDEGYSMIVLWYKSYPGHYILSLIQNDGTGSDMGDRQSDRETGQNANTQAGSVSQSQQSSENMDISAQQTAQQQSTQNAPSPVQSMPETAGANGTSVQNGQASSYDATTLTIRSIPEPLLNYISNRYDFQYSLYDYLYRNGHRDTTKATVTDYAIDADRRMALIELNLDDGGQISATYDHDENMFSFTG